MNVRVEVKDRCPERYGEKDEEELISAAFLLEEM